LAIACLLVRDGAILTEGGYELKMWFIDFQLPTSGAAIDLSEATFSPLNVQRAFPRAPFAADFYQKLQASLPLYDPAQGVVTGILLTDEGQVVRFVNGNTAPTFANYASAGHVEGKAAIYIGTNNSTGGILFQNHTNGICGYCNSFTPTLLPQGATLDIVPPIGATPKAGWYPNPTSYTGNANAPLLNRKLGPGM
jgi:hypothetical protein